MNNARITRGVLAIGLGMSGGVFANIFEGFDASTSLPVGWINGGSGNQANASHYQSPPNCRSLAANQSLQTPLIDFPTNLAFYVDSSNAGAGKTATVDYSVNGGPWTLLASFAVSTAGNNRNYPLTSSPDLSTNANVRFRFNSTFSTWYLDDVAITTAAAIPSNTPPILTLNPPGATITNLVGEPLSVTVHVAELDGDSVALYAVHLPEGALLEPDPAMGVAPLSAVFSWMPGNTGLFNAVFAAGDKDGTNTVSLLVHVTLPEPFLLLAESFDASTDLPPGWINEGSGHSALAAHYQSPPYCRSMAANQALISPAVDYPTNLQFYADASGGGSGKVAQVEYQVAGGAWVLLHQFVVTSVGRTESVRLDLSPDLSGSTQVRFRFSSTFATWYLDDVRITGGLELEVPPVLKSIGPRMVAIGQTLYVPVTATDIDGNDITLYASNLPPGAVFDEVTRAGVVSNTLIYTPDVSDIGMVYTTTVVAADMHGVDEESFTISVFDVVVGFAEAGAVAREDDGMYRVLVVLSRAADVTVDLSVSGTATGGPEADFTLSTNRLVFTSSGEATQVVEVVIRDDLDREPPETVIMTLMNAEGAEPGPISVFTLTILDDDSLYEEFFDADPGWATEGLWTFGVPLGVSGSFGGRDPSSGFTGPYVYGYNLAGNYPDNMNEPLYLTTPAIDCRRFRNVRLNFRRWLGVESAYFDHAFIQVSRDQMTWVDVWRNGFETIRDAAWTNVIYDISAVADGEPGVYIRWGMGPSDYVVTFAGWNIDDVILEGDQITNAVFRFSAPTYSVHETSAVAVITVMRSGRVQIPASIGYVSADGTAVAGLDYLSVSGTLHFAAGDVEQTFTVPLLDDPDVEGDETIQLTLLPTETGEVGSISQATLLLLDDEAPGATVPFFEGFEAPGPDAAWQFHSTDAGRIRFMDAGLIPYAGAGSLFMDVSDYNLFGLNEAVLTVDLRGHTNLMVNFWEYNLDDQYHPMPAQFYGSVPADGVAVSRDGVMWHRLYALPTYAERGVYTNRIIDLTAFMVSKGWMPDAHFRIKFQQYDRYPMPIYGRSFDNIQVYDPTRVADLRLVMTQSENPATPGSNLVYHLVVSNHGPLAASSVTLSNQLPASVVLVSALASQGDCLDMGGALVCELGALDAGESATVTVTVLPVGVGFIVNTASVRGSELDPDTANNRQFLVALVDEPGGALVFDRADLSVNEDIGMVYVAVVRTQKIYGAASVDYHTVDGAALAGSDYVATSGTLHFASGQTVQVIPVAILDDRVTEEDASFFIRLSNPGGAAVLGEPTELEITIRDDDGVAPFPFLENFESGVFSNYWRRYSSTPDGRVQITEDYGPHAGARHVTMDTASWGQGGVLNELVLSVDLAGQQGVTLAFWHKHFNDESHLMSATFTGRQNADGVAVSVNGTNWVKVRGLAPSEGASTIYRRYEVALDPILAAHGLSYNDRFMIKFQQFDDVPIASDGFAFDAIELFAANGAVRFGQAAYPVSETGGVVLVTVERINGSYGTISVAYATSNETAVAGSDYTAVSGVLVLSNGVTSAVLAIPVLDDAADEADETFTIRLFNPAGGALLAAPSTARITILDNDGPGSLQFEAAEFAVMEGAGVFEVSVVRRGGTEGLVAVNYATGDGTATSGVDYQSATGTLVFAEGVIRQTFAVEILQDDVAEGAETIMLILSEPIGGASLGAPAGATLTIIDDENPYVTYYQDAYGKTGTNLHAALHGIIREGQLFDYSTVWTILKEVDEHPDNTNEVLLVYKQEGRSKNNNGGNSGQWNREHVWPRSRGFSGDPDLSKPPSVDVHHIRAADVELNNLRGNKDFVAGGAPVPGAPPSCRTTDTTFEPPDASKGDVARMILYMDVRYQGSRDNEPDLRVVDVAPASGVQVGKLSQLIAWHFQDPPDAFEMRRNDLIYQNWQGNRNPFVDHPEWVSDIWGGGVLIQTTNQGGGTISPHNPEVYYGANQQFDIVPAPYYRVAAIWTNGQLAAADFAPGPVSFTWNQVRSTGALSVVFAELVATNQTPLWWLAQYGITNDVDAAALADQDGDAVPTWEEYIAGTDPTDPGSVFVLAGMAAPTADGALVLIWPSVSNRTYAVWVATNPLDGFNMPIAVDLLSTPPENRYTTGIFQADAPAFLLRVTNNP